MGYMSDWMAQQNGASIGTQPNAAVAAAAARASEGLDKYDAPQYATPYAPRSGPGGYPLGGYSGPVSGYGGLDYAPFTGNAAAQGLPAGFQGDNGFAAIARYALQGSAEAEQRLREAYGSALARRTGGIMAGQQEFERSLGYAGDAQGLSGSLATRAATERRAMAINAFGNATAESGFGLNTDLATLAKGTATELAGVKRDELNLNFQAYLARKALKNNSKNALIGAAGELVGAGIGAYGSYNFGAGAG